MRPADICVEFRFREGSKNDAALRSRHKGHGRSRIQRLAQRIDRRSVEIAANANNGLAPIAPMRGLLGVDADAAFLDLILTDGRKILPLVGIRKKQIDRVKPCLHADLMFRGNAREGAC